MPLWLSHLSHTGLMNVTSTINVDRRDAGRRAQIYIDVTHHREPICAGTGTGAVASALIRAQYCAPRFTSYISCAEL